MKRSDSIIFPFLFLSIFLQLPVFGQSTDKNYIKETDLLIKENDTSNIGSLQDGEKLVTIQYFDGLGRLIQTNAYHHSPNRNDIIQHFEYDGAGRQKFSFLPFSYAFDGNYSSDAYDFTLDFYSASSWDPTVPHDIPFGETAFDDSPLNRVMKQGFPGGSWQLDAHPQQFNYMTNAANDIPLFQYNAGTHQYFTTTCYPAQSLYVTETLDENQNPARTYKDKQGRILVQESELSGTQIRTCYIYDSFGNLALVISPEGSKLITGSFTCTGDFVKKWCYSYTYDHRQRLIEKRIPGMTSPICYIYDRLDRVILTQDGNLKQSNKWLFTKYDVYGRPVMEGKYWNNQFTSRSALQDYVIATENSYRLYESRSSEYYTLFFGYTMLAFPPATGSEILKVYYYDNYDFDSNGSDDYSYCPVAGFGDLQYHPDGRGLATGTRIKMMDAGRSDSLWLISVNFYDTRQRIIQQQSNNHLAGYDTITTRYNFIGDATLRKHSHSGTNIDNIAFSLKIVRDSLVYDHARHLKESWQKVNSQSYIRMAQMTYNELGQLTEKNLDNASGLVQSVDYRYNIRGWLKGINTVSNGNDSGDKFFEELQYDGNTSMPEHKAQYNGNIAAIRWKSSGMSDWRGYAYYYDSLNRISQALFGNANTGWPWTPTDTYSVPLVQYDRNGNITRLKRMGTCSGQTTVIDDLTYNYNPPNNSNLLYGVFDAGSANCGFKDGSGMPEYNYDACGNAKFDRNKGITDITYNHLNLPEVITLENNRRIEYNYDANGVKLQKRYYVNDLLNTTTDYSGPFVYTNRSIDYILTAEGRLKRTYNGTDFSPEFFLMDHLSNVRVVLSSPTTVSQETDYYPFGMEIPVSGSISLYSNQRKYNSKELQTDADLQWYDYGARMYDPQIGRWHVVDLLADKFPALSPYQYASNNPVVCIDIDGLEGYKVTTKNIQTGVNEVKFIFDIKVKNSTNASSDQIKKWGNIIEKSAEGIFKGYDKKNHTYYSTELNLDYSSIVRSTDYALEFKDEVFGEQDLGGQIVRSPADGNITGEIGNVESNIMEILIPGKSATLYSEEVNEDSLERTSPHELGHTAGLRHQKRFDEKNEITIGENNLMYIYGNNGKEILIEQLRIMSQILKEKK